MNFDIERIIQRVTDTLKTETVVGQPITVGEITMIPLINVSFGFGGGAGDDQNRGGCGGGGGGGARLTVAGMMVVKGDDVKFIPTATGKGSSSSLDKLLEALPDLVQKISKKAPSSKEQSAPNAEEPPTKEN